MSTFIQAYRDYVDGTEPPKNFHVWTAMSTVSALLGRKCFIPQGHFTVYPQLYVVLVGPPGSKKSTSLNVGKRLLRSIEGFPLAPESTTREALLDALAENRMEYTLAGKQLAYYQAAVFASELAEFIGGKHINSSTVGMLTSIWDEDSFDARTRHSGAVKIPNPYLSLIACCTPTWVTQQLKGDIITDGFARRTVFVYETERACLNPWPETTPKQHAAWQVLLREIQRIHAIKGQFTFTADARELWDPFYYELQEFADKQGAKTQNYYSSKHVLVLKLSMCLSACYNNSRIVDASILQLAIKFFHETEHSLEEVFSGMGRNELKPFQDKILAMIQSNPEGITRRPVIQEFSADLTIEEIESVIRSLTEGGLVELQVRSAHEPPVLKATTLKKPRQAVDLLELASRLSVDSPATPSVPVTEQVLPPDPARQQLEAAQSRMKSLTARGILPLGKRPGRPEESTVIGGSESA